MSDTTLVTETALSRSALTRRQILPRTGYSLAGIATCDGHGIEISDLRGHPRSEFIPGKFIHPHAGKYLHNGDILVVEWVPIGRVTLLRKMRA